MAIAFTCDGCGAAYKVPDEYAGKRTACKSCKTPLTVPTTLSSQSPTEEDQAFAILQEQSEPIEKPHSVRAAWAEIDDDRPTSRSQPASSREPQRNVSNAARDMAAQLEKKEREQKKRERNRDRDEETSGISIHPSIVAGIGAIVLALIWLGVGLALNRLFLYPFIMIGGGLIGIIRGFLGRE